MIALQSSETSEVEILRQQVSQLEAENARLQNLVYTDALTEIANRRNFDESLDREWGRSIRTGEPLTLLMVDIDHFKPFNDMHGHPAGDRLLRQVAKAIASVPSRSADLVSRFGGEEFAVLLPDTNQKGGEAIAALMLDTVRSCEITISIGVGSVIALPFCESNLLVDLADKALYRAKAEGRNRICVLEV